MMTITRITNIDNKKYIALRIYGELEYDYQYE